MNMMGGVSKIRISLKITSFFSFIIPKPNLTQALSKNVEGGRGGLRPSFYVII
jgi:hypothetical protein